MKPEQKAQIDDIITRFGGKDAINSVYEMLKTDVKDTVTGKPIGDGAAVRFLAPSEPGTAPRILSFSKESFKLVTSMVILRWMVRDAMEDEKALERLTDQIADMFWPWDTQEFKNAMAKIKEGKADDAATAH